MNILILIMILLYIYKENPYKLIQFQFTRVLNLMSKSNKKGRSELNELSGKAQFDQSAIQGQISSSQIQELPKQLYQTSFVQQKKGCCKSRDFTQICIIITIIFLVIALIGFVSLSLNCILSKDPALPNQNLSQSKVINSTNISNPIINNNQNGNNANYDQVLKQKMIIIKQQQIQIQRTRASIANLTQQNNRIKQQLKQTYKKISLYSTLPCVIQFINNPTSATNATNNRTINDTNNSTINNSTKQSNPDAANQNSTQSNPDSNSSKIIININSNSSNSNDTQNISNSTSTISDQQAKKHFKVRGERKNIPPVGNQDHYQFSVSMDQVVNQSSLKFMYPNQASQWSGIKKSAYQRAVRLMQVTHNVNIKGQFVFDHAKFYPSPQQKYRTLSKLLQDQKKYYQQKYQISKYIKDQIGICVYLPSYNNAKNRLYLRNLDSVFQQQYKNYHVVYVNDASTDGTGDYVQKYMDENQIPKQKYQIINNEVNRGNCHNVFMAAHSYCKAGQIMVLLDGDDALIGRQVFSLLNAVYQKQKVALTYGQFLLVRGDRISSGFSRTIPTKNLQDGTFRKLKGFFTSHLKTMYVDVMRHIKATDLMYENGTYYDYASDVAYMTPAIQLVGTRLKFLKQLNYEYRFDTGSNEPHAKQIIVQNQVYLKNASKKMQNMTFADQPTTIHYQQLD